MKNGHSDSPEESSLATSPPTANQTPAITPPLPVSLSIHRKDAILSDTMANISFAA